MATVERLESWCFGILRGPGNDAGFAAWVHQSLGAALPERPNTFTRSDSLFLWWLAPDAWLVQYEVVNPFWAQTDLEARCHAAGGAWVDVSDAYQGLALRGAGVAALLNRGCPLDLHATVFPAGSVARTVCFDVPVWIKRLDYDDWVVLASLSMFEHLSHMLTAPGASTS